MKRILKPQKHAATHEELFVQRYSWLMSWALQLTQGNRYLAENLVHDAFVQFVLSRPDLNSINNIEAYLYTTLKNMHLSTARRLARDPEQRLVLVEYDSVALALWNADPNPAIQHQDELRLICQYACLRKETSKAGSVLILRFFHGYYPSEIARILNASNLVVKKRLQMARLEARAYIEHGEDTLNFIDKRPKVEVTGLHFGRPSQNILSELQAAIFASHTGDCFSRSQLEKLYAVQETRIESGVLAHIVSCRQCLEETNRHLGLASLADRYPTDMTGNDPTSRGGDGSPPPTGGSDTPVLKRALRNVEETFEHYPKELRISANGIKLGAQRVNSALIEQNLKINIGEQINFVEVHSEQGVRLLLLNIEQPPDGDIEQHSQVDLCDGRSLELSFSFSSVWPTLYVVYRDPGFAAESAVNTYDEIEATSEEKDSSATVAPPPPGTTSTQSSGTRFRKLLGELIRRASGKSSGFSFWLRPGAVTALVALLLVAAMLFVMLRRAPAPLVSAAALLNQSAANEQAITDRTDQVLHRTISFEERSGTGVLISQRKIEVWQSAERDTIARRLYDERGALIAGDWRRKDGVQTLYHHGAQPRLQLAPEKRESAALGFDNVWQLSPSAKEFSFIIGGADKAQIEERSDAYLISYASQSSNNGLLKATLVLNRADLRAINETLTIRQGNETRDYSLIEASFERLAPSSVAPAVFEPDPELLSSKGNPAPDKEKSKTSDSEPLPISARAVATSELEVEVLHLLSQIGADLGEEVSVTHTPERALLVSAIVGTEQRKSEILRALNPVTNNPAVKLEIETAEEARQRSLKPGAQPSSVVERVESESSGIPVSDDLRAWLSKEKGLSPAQIETAVNSFASRQINRSSQSLQHAWALKHLVERFSREELRALSGEARAKWLEMIAAHGVTVERETRALRQELEPPFFPVQPADEWRDEIEIANDQDLIRAVERLFELCSANHNVTRSAFAISPESARVSALKTAQFWRSLRSAERLAARINSATQKLKFQH